VAQNGVDLLSRFFEASGLGGREATSVGPQGILVEQDLAK
jgi:hypothetical protein